MKSDTLLDYALLQLSPKGSRCELLISSDGNTEKLASGLVKPFLDNLKFAEDQAAFAVQSIKLEIDRHKNAETWFTKGTFERFVRYVDTPETLEMVNTFDAETSQLEAARKIYSQRAGDRRTDSQGGDGTGVIAVADATTKELLRAIDVRLGAVRQDLTAACARASASGFNPHSVSHLKLFAHRFGAHRLNEACTKYMLLYERRPDLNLSSYGKPPGGDEQQQQQLRSSINSDMSIDNDDDQAQAHIQAQDHNNSSTWQPPKSFATITSLRRNTNTNSNNVNNNNVNQKDEEAKDNSDTTKEDTELSSPSSLPPPSSAPAARRLSVQDKINLFEKKQKENSTGKPELRRLSSDVFRRWSSSSDMSIDVSGEKKGSESPLSSSASSSVFQNKSIATSQENNNNNSENVSKTDQGSSQDTSKVSVFDEESLKDQVGVSGVPSKGSSDRYDVVGSMLSSGDEVSDVKVSGGMKSHVVAPSLLKVPRSHSRSFSAQCGGGGGSGVELKSREAISSSSSSSSSIVVEGVDQSTPQPNFKSFAAQPEQEVSQVIKTKYQKLPSVSQEQTSMPKRDEIRGSKERTKLNLPGKTVLENQDNGRVTATAPLEQIQRVRQPKGNQELHDELKMKADELEKLFAEHKLRVPGDQSGSARRIEPADARVEQVANSQSRRPGVGDSTPQPPSRSALPEPASNSQSRRPEVRDSTPQPPSRSTLPEPAANSQSRRPGAGDLTPQPTSRSSLPEPTASSSTNSVSKTVDSQSYGDDSRGKFYEKYMKKRNAKLQEEWSSNREEKEARMKAMQDSLERSRVEMMAKFSGSINRQSSVGGTHRAEKLKYFKSNIKRDQHPIDSLQNEDDEDLSEFSEEKSYGASKQSRKNFSNRHVSSVTPRTTAVSASRSSGKRRDNNPLAQSVPNFSDLRKENTKPSSGVSEPSRYQVRNYARSKSSNEDIQQGVKEEKVRQSLSLRKSSANPAEFRDLPSLNSDEIVLTPLKFDLDETDLATEEQDEIGTTAIEDYAYNNNGKMSQSQESGKSESEIGDSTRSLAQLDPTSGGETPNAFPTTFNGAGSLQDSPVESPVSWNSGVPHPFSYPHESSDIDASADSPIGSPASWNFRSLNHGENDAARMRKKWGSAQKPFLVANTSQSQPRKDVTKGFKRLLKFGRKTRGSENLADWISATTSEGDDDMEDGRDLANRSSEDLRKSRMGFSHGHPSDDSFNESELFNEQVQSLQSSIPAPPAHFKLRDDHVSGSSLKAPKSFFSLSTFRSKGSDSKPR